MKNQLLVVVLGSALALAMATTTWAQGGGGGGGAGGPVAARAAPVGLVELRGPRGPARAQARPNREVRRMLRVPAALARPRVMWVRGRAPSGTGPVAGSSGDIHRQHPEMVRNQTSL